MFDADRWNSDPASTTRTYRPGFEAADRRPFQYGRYLLAAAPIGGIVAGPLSGWVMTALSGTAGPAGWQWLFIFEGIPAALLGIVALFWLKDSPEKAPWLSASELSSLSGIVTLAIPDRAAYRSLPAVLANAPIYRLAAAYFCLICGLYAIGFWLPAILEATGLKDVLEIGPYIEGKFQAVLVGDAVIHWGSLRVASILKCFSFSRQPVSAFPQKLEWVLYHTPRT